MANPTQYEIEAGSVALPPTSSGLNHQASAHPVPAEPSAEETFVFPASIEQDRYWTLAQLNPGSTASNMAIAFDIEGEMDEVVAERAIAALTMRHEALRTIFRLEAGLLSQIVVSRPLYRFSVEDLRSLRGEEQTAALKAAISRHGHQVIDLRTGPVLYAHLVHLGTRQHVMALTMHHIVCDGWSNGILIRDFTLIYEALLAGREPALPELPFQFADFTLWQKEYLASPAAKEAAAFWTGHLRGGDGSEPAALDLPTDHARPEGRTFPGHIESALLPTAIDERLKAYCRETGSTKHIVLLAAFQALCATYTGQTFFLLGSTIANRTQPGMEDVVGRFANPQMILANAEGDPTFAALEQRVREWETAAYTHQDLPFSRVIEEFQLNQHSAGSSFLQVWFLYQKAFMQPQYGETIRVLPRRSVSGGVDFDMLVSVVERAEGPRIQIEYNTVLFEAARVRNLIDSFVELLDIALREPERRLSQLRPARLPEATRPHPSAAADVIEPPLVPTSEKPVAFNCADSGSLTLSEVEEKLSAIWKDVLDLDSIDTASSFFDLGGTSVLLVRLFSRINKAFNTSMPITTIFDAQTISSLAMVLGAGAPMSHLVQVQTGGSKPPLFMVHSYLLYQGLSKSLGTDQPFYGLRELKEEGQLNLEERTARYVAEIRKVQPQGPYNIAGWCAAGPLTIELARQLLQAGEEVSYLALFDSWLPGYLEMLASTQDSDSWLPWGAGNKFSYHRNRIRGMALSKKASYCWTLISRLVRETRDQVYLRNWQRLQTLAEKFNFPLPQFMHNTTLQTFSALRNYQGKRLPVRVTLIRASEAREVKGATVSCGWERIAEKGVDVVWAPGDHETMFLGENLKVTSDIVRRGMETTVSGGHAYSATINGLPSPSMLPVIHVDCPTT